VLELDPKDAKGLWYGALAAAEQGETAHADDLFGRLLALDPPAEFREAIERRRAALGGAGSFNATVELDATLAGAAPEGGVLFVYLRRPGEPMPLAARRVPAGTFPAELALGHDDLLRGIPIPADEPLVLGARISASGTAVRNPGDPYGEAEIVAGRRAGTVRIDARVP
jgi:hypothetical protein